LGLEWNSLEVMRRFRDKFALKQFLRASHPAIRINRSILVRSAAHVFAAGAEGFARFVLKPNDGYGNRDIGIFDSPAGRESIEQFFAKRSAGREFVRTWNRHAPGAHHRAAGCQRGRGAAEFSLLGQEATRG
jgi:hypothetical protein